MGYATPELRADERDPRRCIPVRLQDVPLNARLSAARTACRHEQEPDERAAILMAALFPSNRTYWIAG